MPQRWVLLGMLDEGSKPEMTESEVGEQMTMYCWHAQRILEYLIGEGWVSRRTVPTELRDARLGRRLVMKNLYSVTEEGRAAARALLDENPSMTRSPQLSRRLDTPQSQ